MKAATATNPVQITTTIPHGLTTGQVVTIVGISKNIDNTQIAGPPAGNTAADGNNLTVTVIDGLNFTVPKDGTVAGNGTAVGSYASVLLPPPFGLLTTPIPNDYRELDPIRRPCATGLTAKEDVCNRDGNLGLVLPIVPTDFLGSIAAQYPTSPGVGTKFSVAGTVVLDPNTPFAVKVPCPNGDPQHSGNLCVMPVDPDGNTNCLNPAGFHPFVFDIAPVNGIVPGAVDGRVYNSHLLTGVGGAGVYQVDALGRSIVGAWYRIHSLHTLAPGATKCTQVDATNQIGCLVQASPCSIGYAGRTADAWDAPSSPTTLALKVNQVLPLAACVQSFRYALSRKLYLNTLVGWGAVPASDGTWGTPELNLVNCEATEAFMGPIVTSHNFVNFAPGSAPNGGSPFAEDFNEESVCPAQAPPASNVNAVAFTGNAAPLPSVGTVCGNGIKEAYEDCDDGTVGATTAGGWPASYVPVSTGGNGSPGSQCTTTCRWIGLVQPCDNTGKNDVTHVTCLATTDNGVACHTAGAVPGKCQTASSLGCCLP